MKKAIVRNIAIVSAIFIVAFSIMLITNYFQVRGVTPLQTEVIETLKEVNDRNAGNPALQEQIRQLDLLARKAYFVRMDNLVSGVYILIGMLVVFVVCARVYFAREKDIPDKEIDPIDEWAMKTQARKYVVWGATGLAAAALLFMVLTSPYLRTTGEEEAVSSGLVAEAENPENSAETDMIEAGNRGPEDMEEELATGTDAGDVAGEPAGAEAGNVSAMAGGAAEQPPASRVTHNAFRGNTGNGISSARGVPVKWDLKNGTNIAWKKDVPRQGYNSPVINGNRVFFSGADAEARELYCYDLNTGDRLWSLAADNIPGSPSQMPKTNDDTGLAASSVATNGTQVCAIFATGDIICAEMDGKRLWGKNLGVPDNHYGYASSLLIFGNVVIVQYDNRDNPRVMALDLATGAERWNKRREEKITWSSPIIATVGNTSQLVLMGNPAITGYNPNNGEQLWRVECMSGEVGASACSANGIIFGASEYAAMVAINGADGAVLWKSNDYLPEVASPVATRDNVYIATSYGMVVAFDAKTGELRKEHELNTEFYSSPVIAEGKLYLFGNNGKVHIFSANNDFTLVDAFETGERTFASPAFTDGKIVVRTEKSIYCVTDH